MAGVGPRHARVPCIRPRSPAPGDPTPARPAHAPVACGALRPIQRPAIVICDLRVVVARTIDVLDAQPAAAVPVHRLPTAGVRDYRLTGAPSKGQSRPGARER